MNRRPKSHYRHMTRQSACEIRRAYFARESKQSELAAKYGTTQSTISKIISEQVWAPI